MEDEEVDNQTLQDIQFIIDTGRSLQRRCEAIIEALHGMEEDVRTLRRVVKDVHRILPKESKIPNA